MSVSSPDRWVCRTKVKRQKSPRPRQDKIRPTHALRQAHTHTHTNTLPRAGGKTIKPTKTNGRGVKSGKETGQDSIVIMQLSSIVLPRIEAKKRDICIYFVHSACFEKKNRSAPHNELLRASMCVVMQIASATTSPPQDKPFYLCVLRPSNTFTYSKTHFTKAVKG